MGLAHSPRMVTDGLVLCLDAANPKSYPGSGTTWTDLSGRGNNGVLTNMDGANLSSSNLGSFTFDGVNESVDCGNNSAINFGTGNFTVSLWFKRFSNATTNLRLLSKAADTDTASRAGFSFFGSNSTISFAVNPSAARTIITAATYSLNEWVNVTGLLERGVSMRTYKNGNLVSSTSAPEGSISGDVSLFIANNSGANLFWAGEIAQVLLYNKSLSVNEITQNFNALRGRFGL